MPTEKVKTIKINLNLTDTNVFKNETYESNETFWTTDVNSAYLEFTTTNDLTNSIASLVLKNIDDGSLIQRNIETNESPFFYKLRDQEIIRAGRWYGQIVLESDGKSLTAAVFRFKIKGSLLDSSSPALVDIDNYRKLSDQLTTLYDQMNTYLANAAVAEEAREVAEVLRKTVFEDSQTARKLDFEESEKNRSITFAASENDRKNLFKQNEETRQSNEDGRVLAENNRRTAFEESQTSRTTEFNLAETNRSEVFKMNEEERISNESDRKQAELSREETYYSKVDAAIVKADVVTKVDAKVAELSPTIQNVTAQLAQKANKDEVTNIMTPKGNKLYNSLPKTGNTTGDYYYSADGNGVNGAGNYVWNGTSWYFGGTGDGGYSIVKNELTRLEDTIEKTIWTDGFFLSISTGLPQTNSARSVSGFEMIVGGKLVEYIAETTNQYVASCCFYDKDKLFISSQSNNGTSNNDPITSLAPDNAKYIRTTILTNQKELGYVKSNSVIKDRIENPINRSKSELRMESEIEVTNYALLVDFYPGTDWMNNVFRRHAQSVGNTSTSIVKLDKTKDTFSTNGYTGKMVFLNTNKEFISQASLFYGNPVLKENYPSNAEYVCFWFPASNYTADSWNTTTRDNKTFPKTEYSKQIKLQGTRPRINIYTTDTEIEVYKKLCDAVYTKDCDVYFEAGNYRFDSVFEYIKTSYGGAGDAFEMLLGGDCRYYMYNCTFYAHYSGTAIPQSGYSLFGCHRHADSYEVFGGTWIAEGCVYVCHDEASGEKLPYKRVYHNVTMEYIATDDSTGLSRCVGGGMGLNGHSILDNCVLISDNAASPNVLQWHGCKTATAENHAKFKLSITNCYFSGGMGLDPFGSTYLYNDASCVISGNSFGSTPAYSTDWDVKEWNNEVRTD